MSRLVIILLVATVAVSYVCALKTSKCQVDAECKGEAKACRKGLCRKPCVSNGDCGGKGMMGGLLADCEHDGLRWSGFCNVDRGTECMVDITCESGKKCKSGYCVPKKGW